MGALHEAIREWNDNQIGYLLHHGADVNTPDENGNTPLTLAVSRGIFATTVEELLARGASLHARDATGKTPLMLALDHHSTPNSTDCIEAILAHYDLLQEQPQIEPGYDNGRLALLFAIYRNDLLTVGALLDAGADMNARSAAGKTALMLATELGLAALVHLLFSRGADANAVSTEESKRETALHIAAREQQPECAQALLAYGAEPDVRDEGGRTPLISAAWASCAPIVRLLLEHGADVHAEDNEGGSALHDAAWLGDEQTIRTLLAWGAGDNKRHLQGAFGCCFLDNNHNKAAIFLEAGAQVGLREALLMRDRQTVHRLIVEDRVDVNEGHPIITAAAYADGTYRSCAGCSPMGRR
jgi:ankyrin repeat protein